MIKNYNKGEIVILNWPKGSFSWTNGIYCVIKTDKDLLHICRMTDDLKLNKYENNELDIHITGINNKNIKRTKLKYCGKI